MSTSSSHQVLERQEGKGLQPQFSLDDAFSDGDDHDDALEFSSAAIRKHLAEQQRRNAGENHEEELATESSSVNGHDASISTLDLDGSTGDSKSDFDSASHASRPPTGTSDELDLPHDLSNKASSEDADELDKGAPVDEEPVLNMHIDVSKPPSGRIVLTTENGDSAALSNENRAPSPQMAPVSVPPRHSRKPSRSSGPTTFQKVMSKTRPHFLPPKTRQEDQKHLADWETMMRQSHMAEEKRRKALQERRLAREFAIEQSMHVWEREIVPDWLVVHRDPRLRKLWWNGIPTKLRASMWERATGNALALSKDNYRSCLSRAKRALSSGVFPSDTLQAIEEDILTTLPTLHIFHPKTGPLYQDLKDMLCAWVVSRADEGLGYTRGASKIAAMILVNMSAPQGFVVMRNLLERHCMRSFYGGTSANEDVEAYYRIFDTLLADSMPKIYFNFKQHQISPAVYLPGWLIPLFLDHLPFEACARIWDVFILEGDSFLFRAALAILAILEPRLFFPDRQELTRETYLGAENKAAIEVARRDGRALDGAKYEIYSVDEETLWERIDSMEEWWRETTWRRLTQRELPDI
ncbi:rab-GTPase-TBC domain-containing protein [Melanogaster broomeanus]|nr:rab-GTPase-TBC domain-containing protein [Melanogaster broomeanus]